MREIAIECPRCGRRHHRPADSWSGITDARRYEVCQDGCRTLPLGGPAWSGEPVEIPGGQKTGLGPALLGLAIVVVPVVGAVLALRV